MDSIRTVFFAFLFSLVTFLAPANASMTYEYDLPGLVGTHKHIDQPLIVPFDLKTKFSSVFSAEIRLEGRANPGLAVSTIDTQHKYVLPVDLKLRITGKFDPRLVDLGAPLATFEQLQDFFQVQQNFIVKRKKNDWSFLQDGTGEIRLNWGGGCPDACIFVDHANAEITRATLIIKGDEQY